MQLTSKVHLGVFGSLGGRLPFRVCDIFWASSVGSLVRSEADSHFRLDDEGVGEKANHTASRTLMSVMRFYACRQ